MNIVITGSLGNISQPLAKELVQKGHTVTVISSKPEKQKDIEALGVIAAIGSLEDMGFLTAAIANADTLFAMVPPNFGTMDQVGYYRHIGSNYVQALQHSAVKHVVYLSSYGAHLDKGTGFILGAHHVENMLNELPGIAITHLRPGYFYYNLFGFTKMIKEAGFMGSNFGGDDKLALVQPVDIAAAAAEEILAPATGRKVRYIASDECTPHEIAQAIGAAIGQPDLKWVTFTDDQLQENLEKNGVPAPLARNFVEIGASTRSGALLADYALHPPAVLGKVKLADFAKEFAAAF
ncbi:NmrA family NAD(P)-binding protein [Chitinophaga sp.]|uniref:NmrA family NAD(P)-binding protein n=1 Tax=Chitinophaga sp. TaxID=1869181 RepID=UPI002F93A765